MLSESERGGTSVLSGKASDTKTIILWSRISVAGFFTISKGKMIDGDNLAETVDDTDQSGIFSDGENHQDGV